MDDNWRFLALIIFPLCPQGCYIYHYVGVFVMKSFDKMNIVKLAIRAEIV